MSISEVCFYACVAGAIICFSILIIWGNNE